MIFNILQKTIAKRNINKLVINNSFISKFPFVNNRFISLKSYYNNPQFCINNNNNNNLQIIRNACSSSKNNNDVNSEIANSSGNSGEITIEVEIGYNLVLRRASNILINIAERTMSKVLHVHCDTSKSLYYFIIFYYTLYILFQI
jgi:hypothetical protein